MGSQAHRNQFILVSAPSLRLERRMVYLEMAAGAARLAAPALPLQGSAAYLYICGRDV
jgi:hypothetical protein